MKKIILFSLLAALFPTFGAHAADSTYTPPDVTAASKVTPEVAWASFNGSGVMQAGSGISSIARVSLGRYRVYFSSSMPNTTYGVFWSGGGGNGNENYHVRLKTKGYTDVVLLKDTTSATYRDLNAFGHVMITY